MQRLDSGGLLKPAGGRTTVYFVPACTCGLCGCIGICICAPGVITFACMFYLYACFHCVKKLARGLGNRPVFWQQSGCQVLDNEKTYMAARPARERRCCLAQQRRMQLLRQNHSNPLKIEGTCRAGRFQSAWHLQQPSKRSIRTDQQLLIEALVSEKMAHEQMSLTPASDCWWRCCLILIWQSVLWEGALMAKTSRDCRNETAVSNEAGSNGQLSPRPWASTDTVNFTWRWTQTGWLSFSFFPSNLTHIWSSGG